MVTNNNKHGVVGMWGKWKVYKVSSGELDGSDCVRVCALVIVKTGGTSVWAREGYCQSPTLNEMKHKNEDDNDIAGNEL